MEHVNVPSQARNFLFELMDLIRRLEVHIDRKLSFKEHTCFDCQISPIEIIKYDDYIIVIMGQVLVYYVKLFRDALLLHCSTEQRLKIDLKLQYED